MITEKILGQVPSKSNNYKFNRKGNMYKTSEMKQYEKSFFLQCKNRNVFITSFFEIRVDVYFRSRRSDLDGACKAVMDLLQKCRVIKNDNRCVKMVYSKLIDKANPRVELTIEPVKL